MHAAGTTRTMKHTPTNLHRLVYCSEASEPIIRSMDVALPQILAVAQARNSAVGVTGSLLVCNGWFLQALEGPMKAVLETYGRVLRDPRHLNLKIINATPTRERHFAEWSMCGLQLSQSIGKSWRRSKPEASLTRPG